LVVKQDMAEVLEPLALQRQMMFIILLLVLIVLALILLKVAHYFVRPIVNVAQVISSLSAGRWQSRIHQDGKTSYELSLLVLGVNKMADVIEHQMDELQSQAISLEEKSTELEKYSQGLEALVVQRTAELESLSVIDPLTGLYNRRHFVNQSPKLWRQAARQQQILMFLMLDIDFFKQYNDSQGHQKGDEALQKVAHVLQTACRRSNDLVFRMGGEEMAVLSIVDSAADAVGLAEHIRQWVYDAAIEHPFSPYEQRLTVSGGIALFDGHACGAPVEPNFDALYGLADAALYEAKHTSRNRVVLTEKPIHC
jgi:diguanylate cyclase (GGDEF)-like protein